MKQNVTIALDAMGGDFGPSVVVPAAIRVLQDLPKLHIILVGDENAIKAELTSADFGDRLVIKHASEKVEMDDLPSFALRNKKDSSMRVALNLVKDKTANACVSAGNTGALMATGRFVLKMLPGLDRPAINAQLPAITGHTLVLDVGANVDSSAESLFKFALMGSVLCQSVDNKESPSVGLLNVGEEEIKGNERVKEAARLLTNSSINYIGFVEGDDIFKGGCDVVVCDGFVGNVSVKSAEGLALLVKHFMKQEFNRNIFTRLAGLVALPVLKSIRQKFDHRRYNGASLLGLRGIVVKSHGGADILAFTYAIREAVIEVEKNVPELIKKQLEELLADKRQAG